MAATPFIAFQEPSKLEGYNATLPRSQQPSNIPKTFLDAMEIRKQVFVVEQEIPLENEFDTDDPRACHWVVYASINTITEPQKTNDEGKIIQLQKSVTVSQPIGTIRLVPFPHPPHPEPGSSYAADALETTTNSVPTTTPPYIVDRATTHHDGREPYIKLGRISVLKEFRGSGIAKILVNAAMTWARENPTFFNPSVETWGMSNLGASKTEEIPRWKGLICVHAQEQVAKAWGKWGFELDEGMGTWVEEGINHVGMFQRLQIKD
ncbi:hypothetical protein HYFRA_00008443 [Hymenoscyphus fraxineus]|uniref:N-acetyltransferase domain-containing protein n=1 Tax=Hymenoscyphus fraxineus TaxID=746836 RepID=A0A9N9KNI0_9HELO|nr:hypothetical protein HYFRA_00008443 [Hymenoscyphus fraxineus]